MSKKMDRLNSLVHQGRLSQKMAGLVEREMNKGEEFPDEVINRMGLHQLGDNSSIFQVYLKLFPDGKQMVEKYFLPSPSNKQVYYSYIDDKIDFSHMEPFIGQSFEYFIDGEYQGDHVLTDIRPTSMGVNAIWMD